MKCGIDFFPLDTYLDEKFDLIEAEFGLTGFGVVVKLFQKIYGQQGYYVEFTREVAFLFAKNIGLGGNVVLEIVKAAINRGIFDRTLYEKYQILTSEGIQKRYFSIVSRRKNVTVRGDYLLLNVRNFAQNVNISCENICRNGENVDISQQSKVKESKENIIIDSACGGARENNALSDFIKKYNIEVDLKTVGVLDEIDFNEISAAFEKSAWLKERVKSLQWVVNNYSKIKNGFYSDRVQVKRSGYVEQKSKAEEIDAAFIG